jgi:hypothetical protein
MGMCFRLILPSGKRSVPSKKSPSCSFAAGGVEEGDALFCDFDVPRFG